MISEELRPAIIPTSYIGTQNLYRKAIDIVIRAHRRNTTRSRSNKRSGTSNSRRNGVTRGSEQKQSGITIQMPPRSARLQAFKRSDVNMERD